MACSRILFFIKFGQFLLQVKAQQPPEGLDFVAGPFPVLHREGVQRQCLDAQARAGLDRGADRTDAGLMPRDARQSGGLPSGRCRP